MKKMCTVVKKESGTGKGSGERLKFKRYWASEAGFRLMAREIREQ